MLFHHTWVIRALMVRLRQPGMCVQRRFLAILGLVLVLFLVAALVHLFKQPDDSAMERAALEIFAALGVLVIGAMACAIVIRKKTGASWSDEDALKAAGLDSKQKPSSGQRQPSTTRKTIRQR